MLIKATLVNHSFEDWGPGGNQVAVTGDFFAFANQSPVRILVIEEQLFQVIAEANQI